MKTRIETSTATPLTMSQWFTKLRWPDNRGAARPRHLDRYANAVIDAADAWARSNDAGDLLATQLASAVHEFHCQLERAEVASWGS